jgi:hypothetical protein
LNPFNTRDRIQKLEFRSQQKALRFNGSSIYATGETNMPIDLSLLV